MHSRRVQRKSIDLRSDGIVIGVLRRATPDHVNMLPCIRRSPAMKKLLALTTFAAFAFAAHSAAACDWNREANSQEQTVATTATPSEQTQTTQQGAPAQAPATAVASDQHQSVAPSAPVVLVNDLH
jgi:hypothetical protein